MVISLKGGYYESPIRYNNAELFVDEVIKLENILSLFYKNTNKNKILTEEDEEDYRINSVCRICEKNIRLLIRLEIIVT